MVAPNSISLNRIPPGEILNQVDAITASPPFSGSAQLCRFLRYIVERTLAGDTASLKENLLGTEVFDRGIRYDPRTDPVVRVEARRLRAKLDEYYAAEGARAPIVIRIPKGSYISVFERAGTASPRVIEMAAPAEAAAQGRSVAVLPFVGLGADPETEYFADGLTDEVIHLLGGVPGLNVVSRSSVYRFKDRKEDARELGRLLNAGHLVEGSVRRDGQRLRVATQLVESANGYQSWSQTFERDWCQIFAIQTEIATAIASHMRRQVSGDRTSIHVPRSALYTENLEAYRAFLKGRFHAHKRTVAGFQSAMEAYRQAIAVDPTYAPAWAGLSDCHTMLGFLHVSSPVEARMNSRAAAERAVQLDDRLALAQVALGQQLAIYEWDWDGSMVALHRALELDPNSADAHYSLSKCLAMLGQMDAALHHILRAQQLDPLSLITIASLGWELSVAKRFQESDAAFQAARELDPHFIWTYVLQSWSFENRGLTDEAIRSLRRAAEITPDSTVVQGELAHVLGKTGQLEEAGRIRDALLARAQTQYVSPFDLSRAHEGMGRRDEALAALDLACDERSPLLVFACVEPLFDALRADPRFESILRRMNFKATT
jgi:TolB-like protein/Tfp pilus assembly protein PilF